jgi:DNA-binding transcriptional regulator LsrR (DeoR family)
VFADEKYCTKYKKLQFRMRRPMPLPDAGGSRFDDDSSLAARAAWLHFAGGKTQSEVADRLNIPSTKAHRLIARANREGLIRVFVDGTVAECVALEEALKAGYGLQYCEVAPDLDDGDPLPLRTLGIVGARYLRGILEHSRHKIIGIGHGRTLASAVEYLPRTPASDVQFVSLLGGLTRKFAANPFDVIHKLAERTAAEAYLMAVPAFANSVEDKNVLMSQVGIADVVQLARRASLLIVGIGEVETTGFLAGSGMIRPNELVELKRAGAHGELLGHFFSPDGRPIETDLTARALSLGVEDLRGRPLLAIAGGESKVPPIRAILNSGLLYGLITDEATARGLTRDHPGPKPGKKNNGGKRRR